MRYAIYSYCR
ncbi:terminase large subunit [Vibrio phage Chloris]|nr:terminase large subunit [Vibrio phage Chloris]